MIPKRKRAFQGLVGRPVEPKAKTPGLAPVPVVPTERAKPFSRLVGRLTRKAREKKMILLHFCFDQQSGQTKNEHCVCEGRAIRKSYDIALEYVETGLADWLVVRNAKAKTGTSVSRKSIVIRSAIGPDGNRYFKIPMAWERRTGSKEFRDRKHAAIRRVILGDARIAFQKWFSKGWIDSKTSRITDEKMETLFTNENKEADAFLNEHSQPLIQKELIEVLTHWWNNVLGYLHLDAAIESYMKSAEQGRGEIVVVGDGSHLELVDAMHQTNDGRVRSGGQDPRRYEDDRDEDDPDRYSSPDCRLDDVSS